MSKRMCFWRKDDQEARKHFCFVISDVDVDGLVLVVNMTTVRNTGREDLTCVLHPGDHPCVKQDSYIRYDLAIERELRDLLSEKFAGDIFVEQDISSGLLQRIQEGARKSQAMPRKFQRFFEYF